jgi:hypothetical protein
MMADITYYLIEFLFHSALLMAVLWVMIKLQGFNYTFLGLLGTAAAGGALDMIPVAGHALAVITLYVCITKMTRASMFPDAAFTVAVGYALMFAVKVLAFTALMGDLRPSAMSRAEHDEDQPPAVEQVETNNNSATPVSVPVVSTNLVVSKATTEFIQKLSIKGVTRNGNRSSVTIDYAGKNYVVFQGDIAFLPNDEKLVPVRLEKVESQKLTFSINGELATRTY